MKKTRVYVVSTGTYMEGSSVHGVAGSIDGAKQIARDELTAHGRALRPWQYDPATHIWEIELTHSDVLTITRYDLHD